MGLETRNSSEGKIDKIVGFLSKHFVPISITFKRGDDKQIVVISAFVMSVLDQWFLVTAGHWNAEDGDIFELISHGYQPISCFLIDTLGLDAKYEKPIIFNFKPSSLQRLSDEPEYDYGIIELSQYYREQLEKNNIQALNEEVWKILPPYFDYYKLLGVPAKLVKPTEDFQYIDLVIALCHVEHLEQKPDERFPNTDVPLFYGRIELGAGITDIRGMSGGPIFGFRESEDGQIRYWLVALQSTWLENFRYTKGCPTKILGDYLESQIT